uniref:Cysteine--tRNA ligase n=1 Tax=Candidatus Actinomarina minuta TaxID=1389454 RepID=S5DL11_9ACTN|nr:cysteinyl-tRNA synthetase [Candidatus Actinomarina minuta]
MLNLYNSYTKQQEEVNLNQEDVRIYLCGPTVQSSPHLGHGRSAVVFDFFIRYLKFLNYSVLYVRNITDIDDKIIQKSQEKNINYRELADSVWEEFVQAHENLNCLVPDIEPRATAYVPEIVQYIDQLIKNGFGYITKSGVYYDVSKFDDYLKLSGRSTEEVKTGTRIETEEDKKSPEDFALWKFSKEGEPSWDSPWGVGRPGWHIECSTMINQTLGKTIDFHCGGIDLIFPHHENEIAQSKGVEKNENFVNYWLHNGMLNLSGKKMSKSDGNVKLLNEYIDQYGGEVVRFFFLRAHYRSPQEFSQDLLEESRKTLNNIQEYTKDIKSEPVDSKVLEIFKACMNDDMNTPKLLGEIFQMINESNNLEDYEENQRKQTVKFIFEILGFQLKMSDKSIKDEKLLSEFFLLYDIKFTEIDTAMSEFTSIRNKLRNEKKYGEADEMRDSILKIGIVINDGENVGWYWKNS